MTGDIVRGFDFYITLPMYIEHLKLYYDCDDGAPIEITTTISPPNNKSDSLALFTCPHCQDLKVVQVMIDSSYWPILFDYKGRPLANIPILPYSDA